MARIAVIYSTTDGHTRRICDRLEGVISRQGHAVTIVPVGEVADSSLRSFDKIVVGASIRYGRHSPLVIDFVRRNQQVLDTRPSAFFSVNAVARKPAKSRPGNNPYMRRFLKQVAWRPRRLAVFAGRIDYPKYGFGERMVIRLIMWMTNGPTDPRSVVEFTDWAQVDAFGSAVAQL